ncbi:Porphobilinogen deaminase [Fasciola hepatica]|uniref:hydroxymethylbilane synthase n=1 Tax=Fasciola hepatica TaxID=6192 RepID=A0A4E0RSE1_FASHE|nr:Porphobilinogen deaminase [Fasciola hepatica]
MPSEVKQTVRVGTRRSQLAIAQTTLAINMLKRQHPQLHFTIVEISTIGDKILDVALSKIGDKSLFTKELEVALLNRDVDFVVHSLKDVPTCMPPGLVLGCVFDRASPDDVVLMAPTNREKQLANLPDGAVIGTSALRRVASLQRSYPRLKFVSIRGNLNTRLKKLDEPHIHTTGGTKQKQHQSNQPPVRYDAIILAKAGIERLGWSDRIDQVLSDQFHAVSQGALACECRKEDNFILSILSTLHHESAALSSIAERALMSGLDGGCSTPIGVRSHLSPETGGHPWFLSVDGCVMSLDGSECVQYSLGSELPHHISRERKRRHSATPSISREDSAEGETSPKLTKKSSTVESNKLELSYDKGEKEEVKKEKLQSLTESDDNETDAVFQRDDKLELLNSTASSTELHLAEDHEALFMGVHVKPICSVARLRMARAEHLGFELAKRLLSSGADRILETIRAHGKAAEHSSRSEKSAPVD